jgi:hypothetical protein
VEEVFIKIQNSFLKVKKRFLRPLLISALRPAAQKKSFETPTSTNRLYIFLPTSLDRQDMPPNQTSIREGFHEIGINYLAYS